MMGRRAAACVIVLATTGCGLTVPLDEHAPYSVGSGAIGDSPTGVEPSPSAATTTTGTHTGGSGTAGGTATAGPTSAVPTTGSKTTAPTRDATGTGKATTKPTAPAITTPIKVGVIYASGITGVASALGIKGLATGDTVAQARALAADINRHGGINGRKLTIVPESATNVSSAAQAQQEECTALTQDNHVDVVYDFGSAQYQLATCLRAAYVVYLDDETSFGPSTAATMGHYWYAPGDLTLDRQVKNEIESLAASGWMTKKNRVGVYAYTHDDSTKVLNTVMKPMMAKLGIPIVSVQQVDDTNAIYDGGSVALNFRTAGVDRVLEVDGSPLFIMEAASNQHYHPRFAMQSIDGPGVLIESNAPKDELVGAQGPGYLPYYDIGKGRRPTVSTNETRCHKIMKAAGQGSTDTSVLAFQGQICDEFFFLADAGKAGGGVKAAQLAAGAEALGTWKSAVTFSSSFPDGRSTGSSAYRMLSYVQSCSCFQYTSGLKPLD